MAQLPKDATVTFSLLDGLGFAAAACTTLSFVPQVVRIWRSRSAADISSVMYVMFIAGLMLWTIYGVYLSAWPIIVANLITMALAGSVLWMKRRFSRPDGQAGGAAR